VRRYFLAVLTSSSLQLAPIRVQKQLSESIVGNVDFWILQIDHERCGGMNERLDFGNVFNVPAAISWASALSPWVTTAAPGSPRISTTWVSAAGISAAGVSSARIAASRITANVTTLRNPNLLPRVVALVGIKFPGSGETRPRWNFRRLGPGRWLGRLTLRLRP
jgi:hypothetical protein